MHPLFYGDERYYHLVTPMPKKTPVQSTGVLYGEGRFRSAYFAVILIPIKWIQQPHALPSELLHHGLFF